MRLINISIYLLITLIVLSNCSSELSKNISKSKKAQKAPAKKLNLGPTNVKNQIQIIDRTKAWGLAGKSAVHLYAVDLNRDGHQDLVLLPEYYSVPEFFLYSPKKKKFIEYKKNPFSKVIRASYFSFHDFNKDGVIDVLVGVLNQKTELSKYPLRIFLGKKGRTIQFEELVGAFPKLILPTSSVSVFDFDMDGELDVYAGNWFDYAKRPVRPAPDRLFKGKKGKFVDYSSLLKGEHTFNRSHNVFTNATPVFGTTVCDVDQNGYLDIIVASSSRFPNKIWSNLYDRKTKTRIFKDIGRESSFSADEEGGIDRLSGGNSFYGICTDYNNDGIIDLAVGELFHSYGPESEDRSSILTGNQREYPPKFIRTEYHKDDGSGSWSQGDRRGIWFDYNFDGLDDLLVNNSGFPPKSRMILFRQEYDHSFTDVSDSLGIDFLNPSGTIILDVDQDGRLDIISGQTKLRDSRIIPRIYAFQNQTPRNGKKILKVKLRGKRSSFFAEGATVNLKTNKRQLKKINSYSYGHLNSQNEEGVVFGLQKGEVPLSIGVRWPALGLDRQKRKYPLVRRYSLSKIYFKDVTTLYLCDNARFSVSKSCY